MEVKTQLGMSHAFFLYIFPDVIFKGFQNFHLLCEKAILAPLVHHCRDM